MLLLFCFGCLLWEDWKHFGRRNWAICSCSNTLSLWIDCGFCFKTLPPLKKKEWKKTQQSIASTTFFKKNCCLVSCNFTFVTRGCVYFQLWQLCLMNQLVLNSQGEVPFPALHLFAKCVCSLNSWWWLQLKRAISKRVFSLISQSSVWLLAGIFPLWFHRGCLPKHHTCDSRESVCLFVV